MLLVPDDASTGSYSTYNYWPPTVQGVNQPVRGVNQTVQRGDWYDWQSNQSFYNPSRGPNTSDFPPNVSIFQPTPTPKRQSPKPCPPAPPPSPNPSLFTQSVPPNPSLFTPSVPPTFPPPPRESETQYLAQPDTSCVPGPSAPPKASDSQYLAQPDTSCLAGPSSPPSLPGPAPPRKTKTDEYSEMAEIFLGRMENEIKGGEKKAKSLKVRTKMPAPGQGAGKKKICLKDGNLKNYIINQLENLKKANDKSLRTLADTVMQWSE